MKKTVTIPQLLKNKKNHTFTDLPDLKTEYPFCFRDYRRIFGKPYGYYRNGEKIVKTYDLMKIDSEYMTIPLNVNIRLANKCDIYDHEKKRWIKILSDYELAEKNLEQWAKKNGLEITGGGFGGGNWYEISVCVKSK